MAILRPSAICSRVTDITPELLKEMNIKALLLDVDNTITSYISKEPVPGSIEWCRKIKELGYKIYIVSNNFSFDRVRIMAEQFDLDFVHFAMKPLPKGFIHAKGKLKVKAKECLVVGDQIFTDILGANAARMKSILLDPIDLETGTSFKIRRKIETKLRPKYEAKLGRGIYKQ